MRFNNKIIWSPSDLDALAREKENMPIDQLSIYLGKSKAAIIRKMKELAGEYVPAKKNNRSYIGKRKDLNNQMFRSTWEANVARYFNFIGYKWIYEPQQFFFEKERRGAVSYLPDFYLPEYDIYIEVKGQLISRARGAMNKLKKYHLDEWSKLRAITGSPSTKSTKWFNKVGIPIYTYYSDIKKNYSKLIEYWE